MSPIVGNSGVNGPIMTVILTAITFPIALVIFTASAWLAFGLRANGAAIVLILLPLLWPAVLIGATMAA
jgi:hypothetical protein